MRLLRSSLPLLLALVSGCATQTGSPDLESLLAENDYRAALALLAQQGVDDPALAELRLNARHWRKQQLDQAWQLAEQEEWRRGARVLAKADARLPVELGLTAERLAYTEHHYDFAREHMVRWALQRARHLALEQPALEQARRAALTPQQMNRARARFVEERKEVLALLDPAASLALERQQWRRATHLLNAMLALEPENKPLASRLAHARKAIANADNETRQREARARRQTLEQARRIATSALAAGDYHRAQQTLERALSTVGEDAALEQLLERIHQTMEAAAQRHLAEGDRLYARGNIEASLHSWRRAQQLQPDSSVIEARIQRALRFIDRYHRLKSQAEAEAEAEARSPDSAINAP